VATTADRRLSVRARDAVFAPLNTLGRAETVTRRLSDAIAMGLLRDAEQLPSETDLAATFNVSTVTVREALTALRHRGLVETRRGRGGGSFVTTPPDPAAGILTRRLAEITGTELADLCDHYVAISATAAALAADRAGAEDLARIRASTERFAGARDGGSRRRAESRFHVEVAAAARSARLARAELDLQTEIGPLLWLPFADADAHALAVEQHNAIAAAVAAGDAALARSITTEHVRQALARATAFEG
jgi:DNA-binding FadR family transcriptional regulator